MVSNMRSITLWNRVYNILAASHPRLWILLLLAHLQNWTACHWSKQTMPSTPRHIPRSIYGVRKPLHDADPVLVKESFWVPCNVNSCIVLLELPLFSTEVHRANNPVTSSRRKLVWPSTWIFPGISTAVFEIWSHCFVWVSDMVSNGPHYARSFFYSLVAS